MTDPTPGTAPTFPPFILARIFPGLGTLSAAAIDSEPVGQSWEYETWEPVSSAESGTWDYLEARECDDCGAAILYPDDHRATLVNGDGEPVAGDDGEPIRATEDDRDDWAELIEDHEEAEDGPYSWEECDHHEEDARDLGAEGPMMNYYYPVDLDDAADAARKLADTCLCVVEVDGRDGLALTGGGMDLSWEIAAAFVTLGYLPPVHFADLPNMAGMGATTRNLTTAAAMVRSCELMAARMVRNVDHLGRIEAGLRPVEVGA